MPTSANTTTVATPSAPGGPVVTVPAPRIPPTERSREVVDFGDLDRERGDVEIGTATTRVVDFAALDTQAAPTRRPVRAADVGGLDNDAARACSVD